MLGLASFAQRILASGGDDPIGSALPGMFRQALEAALPMILRQMSAMDPDELARGLLAFAGELHAIADLQGKVEGARADTA